MSSFLTQEHIDQFRREGYCCIENILSEEEIINTRNSFHEELLKYDINHENIINGVDKPPEEVRKKSNISNMFYTKFKLDLQINEKMYNTWLSLMNNVIDEFPLGHFDDIIPFSFWVVFRHPLTSPIFSFYFLHNTMTLIFYCLNISFI